MDPRSRAVSIQTATAIGSSPIYAPIQDGASLREWDTSHGLVSAVGGQDMHALQFSGAEVQPMLSGSSVILDEGSTYYSAVWSSHPSAIGYRRQGHVTGGSHGGSGSATITIEAVAPEFDSGMNEGTDPDEMERLQNFSQGAQENPTAAQTQPISRAVQQTAVVGPGGEPLSVPGAPPAANLGNSMNVGGLTGFDLMMENAGILDALGILPPGLGGGGAGGGGLGGGGLGNGSLGNGNGGMIGKSPYSNRMHPASPGPSPGEKGPAPPPASPGPVPGSTSNVDPLTALAILSVLSKGAQTNNAQPAQGNVGPPQPGEDIGPISPDPYDAWTTVFDGQDNVAVPPNFVGTIPGRGAYRGTGVLVNVT
jgi:hypothetical protein